MKPVLLSLPFFLLLFLLGLPGQAQGEENSPGRKVFEKNKCTQCHTIEAAGITKSEDEEEKEEEGEKIAPPDLSGVGKKHEAKWIAEFVTKKVKTKEGRKHKKKFKGSDKDLIVVSEWLATLQYEVPEKKTDPNSDK